MSDLDDLDFNDISGKKTVKPPEPKKEVSEKPKETGTVLWIPQGDNQWLQKDIAHCTGEEFVAWARDFYPVDLSSRTESFNKLSARVKEFKKILYYHQSSPFQMGRDPITGIKKKNTTLH